MNKNLNRNRYITLLLKILILYFIFFLSFVVNQNILTTFYILISSMLIFFSKTIVESISLYLAIFPTVNIVSLFGDYNKSYFFVIMIVFVLKLLFTQKIHIKLLFVYLIFVSYMAIVSMNKGGLNLTDIIMFINFSPFIFLAKTNKYNDLKQIILSVSFGFLLSSFIGMFKNKIPNLFIALRSSSVSIGGISEQRFSGLAYDTNYYGVWCLMLVSFLLVLYSFSNSRNEKTLYFVLITIIGILGMFTYSKSFFVVMFLLLIAYVLFELKLSPIRLLFLISTLLLFSLLLNTVFDYSIKEFIFSRFIEKSGNLSSLTTHRSVLWMEYIRHISSSFSIFIFGSGLRNPILINQVAHNFFIEIFYLIGCLGFILFFLYLFVYYSSLKKINIKKQKSKIVRFAPICSFFAVSMSLNFLNVIELFLFLYISILFSVLFSNNSLDGRIEL